MNREEIDQLWKDDSNWTWGIIYRCSADPRVFVPRRWRWGGWTVNFSHPRAWISGLAAFALVTVPGLVTITLFRNYHVALAVMVISVVAVITWAHLDSSKGD